MLFGCFWVAILKKTIAMYEIITLEYFKIETLIQYEEALNWDKKRPYLGLFKMSFEKAYLTPEHSHFSKFTKKLQM